MPSAIESAKDKAKQNEGSEAMLGRIAERAAGGLEQVSAKLRARDLDGLIRDAESFARAQPLAFFGASLAAGFLAMRFLKSSQAGESRNPQP